MIEFPLRTSPGQNAREHRMARHRRVKAERAATQWKLNGTPKPAIPCAVLLTRIAPSNGLDSDNLSGSMKAVRDQVAEWLGVDDKREDLVQWRYAQQRGPWGVRIEWVHRTIEVPA